MELILVIKMKSQMEWRFDDVLDLGIEAESIRVCPRSEMIKALDCGIIVSEFVLQSRYYVHFQANTLGKGMNPLILPAMG